MGAQPPRAPCVTRQGTQQGPGLTCACDSCGSEREGDAKHQTLACKGSQGLANIQRITQCPAHTPAEMPSMGQHPGRTLP